jgi:polyhydroxybutyrate depolymerase
MHEWAERNRCPGVAKDWASDRRTVTYHDGDVACESYPDCAGGTEVTLCRIEGGGHTWPGGTPLPQFGKTTAHISATEAMWKFFSAHPREP